MRAKKDHTQRKIETFSEVAGMYFFEDERRELEKAYDLAKRIAVIKEALRQPLIASIEKQVSVRQMQRAHRDALYLEFKKIDYDTKYDVYGCLSTVEREAIPWACWMYGFKENTTY